MSSNRASRDATSGRMNSIRRSLVASYTRRQLLLIIVSNIILYVLANVAYLLVAEKTAVGYLSVHTKRTMMPVKDTVGDLTDIVYRLTADGQVYDVAVLGALKTILIVCGVIFVVRLLFLFLVSVPMESRKAKKVLKPLNELALRADELSKLEFGEDKYQLIEDAISHLDAREDSQLSLGDRDLLGVEAAINNLLVRVRESNRQQARFVNDASHELRTPIAVISGYADMLSRWGKDDEKVLDESIEAIQKESTRMKHLVEQLLFLARGDSGKTALQLEETDLKALMQEAYEESVMIDENHVYKFVAPGDGADGEPVSGDAALGDSATLVMQADAGLLKQAVRILIDNAAKYTKEHDEIVLSVGTADGHPYLQVQDSGIGMAEADVAHMFDRFYRADEARGFEGTGLGLSIAKWIVDKHGGHFEILSRTDLGTRIRIVL